MKAKTIDHVYGQNGFWKVVARDPNGNIKWADIIHNLIVNEGINHSLNVALGSVAKTPNWFIGLTDGTPTVAPTDTLAANPGWTEVTAYGETTRVAWAALDSTAQVITNAVVPSVFTVDTNATTIGGAFLAADNTKGATTGILYSAGAFQLGDKSLDNGETLTITFQVTGSST